MITLFSEGQIGPITIKNRVVMPPMCMFTSDDAGFPNEFHYTHYVQRAIHQVGLIIVEATAVSREGRISGNDLGIWNDDFIAPFKKIVDDCHKYNCKIALQLGHAGRKCSIEDEVTIAPSALIFDDRYKMPQEMNKARIDQFVLDMKLAAIRADAAGFDAIEIHGAHGYLINQFLSPITNQRADEYGGSTINRGRLLKEVLETVGSVFPKHKAVIVRISAEEYVENGLHPQDLAEILNSIGSSLIDAVNVSTGGVVISDIEPFPGYQTKPAEIIKALTSLTTISGGMVYDPQVANEIIANDRADFVFIGRGLLHDAAWVIKAQKVLKQKPQWPKPYENALSRLDI